MGKVLVAGSNGGIGAAVVQRLINAGSAVYGVDRDSIDSIDITVPGGAELAVKSGNEVLGGLTGVVHAIGMSGRKYGDGSITACTDEAWAELHRVNYDSAFRLLRAAIPALARSGGGSIVLIGSALAQTLDDDFLTVAYASSKGALVSLMRSAAFAAAPENVRINIVAPGLVTTPMAARALSDDRISARLPALQRLGGTAQTPEEVANVVTWLLSDDSATLTGAVLPADRGWTLR